MQKRRRYRASWHLRGRPAIRLRGSIRASERKIATRNPLNDTQAAVQLGRQAGKRNIDDRHIQDRKKWPKHGHNHDLPDFPPDRICLAPPMT